MINKKKNSEEIVLYIKKKQKEKITNVNQIDLHEKKISSVQIGK